MGKLRAASTLFLVPVTFVAVSACQHSNSKSEQPAHEVNRIEVIEFRDLPGLEESEIQLGGFSGLTFDGNMSGRLTFKTHTDRGPNENPRKTGAKKSRRPFLIPDFQPRWVQFSFEPASKTLRLDNQILLTHNGRKMTGLPNKFEGDKWDEFPVDKNDKPISLDLMGIDPEAIVRTADGSYWMSEEYRPSLMHFSADGKMLKRLVPEGSPQGTGEALLPGRYLKRRMNGGFEGIAFRDGTVYGFLQSSLGGEEGRTRILAVDSETGKTKAEYLYEFDKAPEGTPAPNKIGDAAALPDGSFLVIEQNSEAGAKAIHNIYRFTPGADGEVVKKTLLVNLVELGLSNFEKIEGLALIDNKTLALVTDNDFALMKKENSAFVLVHLAEPLFK